MLKLEIGNEQDRLTVGAILMKNGYRVWLDKETKPGLKKPTYIVCADRNAIKQETAIPSNELKKSKMDAAMSKLATIIENHESKPEQLGFGT